MPPTGKQTVLGTFGVLAVFAAVFAFGLSGDCTNEQHGRDDTSRGLTCLLGKRPVPFDQIRARLDETGGFARQHGYDNWPGMCEQFFRKAINVSRTTSWDGPLAAAGDAVKTGDLDKIAAAVPGLYAIADWSKP